MIPRPDAVPVVPARSRAALSAADAQALFGAALRGTERVAVVHLGRELARVPVAAGRETALWLDTLADAPAGGLRLVGPTGAMAAPAPAPILTRLVMPAGLARAWGLGASATLALGDLAVRAAVETPRETGVEARVEAEAALWLAAGRPATARWLPGVGWAGPFEAAPDAHERGPITVPRRVVTETDVRQARLHGRTIRLAPGQIVTPAARSLARDLGGVLEP